MSRRRPDRARTRPRERRRSRPRPGPTRLARGRAAHRDPRARGPAPAPRPRPARGSGTPTRAPTCSCCRAWSTGARCRCWARGRRSGRSTTAPSTTTCWRRRRSSRARTRSRSPTEIALFGIGAVAAVWWLARLVGGPVAGLAAALLAAVSPAGIEASTFIWNPNLIPLASAVAFAAALYAIRSRHARWWLLSALGAMVVMQCHVLGVVVVPPLLVAWLADVRGRRRRDERLGPLVGRGRGRPRDPRGRLPAAARLRAPARLRGDAGDPRLPRRQRRERRVRRARPDRRSSASVDRLAGVGACSPTGRCSRWPPSLACRPRRGRDPRRAGHRPAGGGLAGRLRRVVGRRPRAVRPEPRPDHPGLPNDHYHSFLDPLVLALRRRGARPARRRREAAGEAVPAGSRAARGRSWPPRHRHRARRRLRRRVAPGDVARRRLAARRPGGRADDRGRRTASRSASSGSRGFKNANAMRFPLEHRGATPLPDGTSGAPAGTLVVVCDPLFDDVVGAACGGPAEDALLAGRWRSGLGLIDRFDAGSRRVISIYGAAHYARRRRCELAARATVLPGQEIRVGRAASGRHRRGTHIVDSGPIRRRATRPIARLAPR